MSAPTSSSSPTGGWRWLTREEWLQTTSNSPAATYYHTPHWCECVAAWHGQNDARALGLSLADGTRVALPLLVRKGLLRVGPLARGMSTMPNTYGGPVAEHRALTEGDWTELFGSLGSLPLGKVTIHATPGQLPPAALTPDLSWRDRNTYLIRLDEIAGELVKSYHKGCASSVKKGRRTGLTASRITTSAELKEYHAVYLDSVKRWGKESAAGYPFGLFESLHALPGVEFWSARLAEGKIVAGGIFLYWGRSVRYWQGAMLAEFRDVCPANFLLDFLLEDARARGLQLFDFNPSGHLKGVEAFKASFGAASAPSPKWTWHRALPSWLPGAK
jgi:hypothetical protein